jgi:predicted transcriptional regulator
MIRLVSKRQIKAARSLLQWTQGDLARAAEVGIATVKRLESGAEMTSCGFSTVRNIVLSLEASGIEFLGAPYGELGVRLRQRHSQPTREG